MTDKARPPVPPPTIILTAENRKQSGTVPADSSRPAQMVPRTSPSGSAPGNYSTRYQTVDRLRDIDRVMCMLSGKPMNEILTIEDALTRRFQDLKTIQPGDDYSNEVDSEFFSLKFWKKGTLHMTFRDPFLWREFNLQAAKGKNWLGDGE